MNQKLKLSVLLYQWVFILGILIFPFKIVWAEESYCWVENESDSSGTEKSFRWTIEQVYNVYSYPYCAPPDVSPGDNDYFEQAIIFATEGLGVATEDAVNKIVLGGSSRRNDALNFENSSDILVIGNWSEENVTDPDSEINYSSNYSSLYTKNYGTMVLDGQSYFDEGESPLTCASGTSAVYFRNVVLLTSGISEENLPSCIHNAGAFYICPGEFNENVDLGDSGWCEWEENEEEETNPDDQDGDGYLAESAGGDDCDDTSKKIHPDADEYPEDGIDQDCDGLDGGCSLTVSPSTITINAGESYEFTANFENIGGYDKSSTLTVSGMDDTMSSDSGFELQNGDESNVTITTTSETPAATYSLTFKARSSLLGLIYSKIAESVSVRSVSSSKISPFFYSCESQVNLTVTAISIEEPQTPEDICDDGYDNDGDTLIDCSDSDCSENTICIDDEDPPVDGGDDEEFLDVDFDQDGYFTDEDQDGLCNGSVLCDCDDTDVEISPDVTEICDDGVDNNCNGFSCTVGAEPPTDESGGGCSLSTTFHSYNKSEILLFCWGLSLLIFLRLKHHVRSDNIQ